MEFDTATINIYGPPRYTIDNYLIGLCHKLHHRDDFATLESSVEVQGQIAKKLTPAGWLLFAIALISLCTSIASELIRVNMRSGEQLQSKAEEAQKIYLVRAFGRRTE
jgi:hypothetical protein